MLLIAAMGTASALSIESLLLKNVGKNHAAV